MVRIPIGVQAPMLHVADDSDNLRLSIHDADVDALADRILIGEIFARETFINHDHRRRMFVIVLCEKTPAVQWNSHRAQIIGSGEIEKRLLHLTLTGRLGLPTEPKWKFVV